ncbi:Dynein heavy chain, partial [Phytophthora palmivora]
MKLSLHAFHEALDSKDVDEIDDDDRNEDEDDDKNEDEEEGAESKKEADNLVGIAGKVESLGSVKLADMAIVARRRLRKHIREFASLQRIPSSIYQLSECLGVLLGIKPVEGHDEMDPDEIIKNYWKNVAVEVNTETFWKTLMTFDVPTSVTAQMVSTLLPICTSPDFDKDLFASVHEIAGVLCEWVQTCTTFAQEFILAEPKYAQLLREQELLKEADAQVVKRKVEIFEQTTSSRQANELREMSEIERQKADEKLQGTNSLLHLTNAAWKVLSSTRENWQQKYDYYSEFASHWKDDLLLATATVTYASYSTFSARLQLYQLWKETIAINLSSSRRPLHEVFSINEVALSKMTLMGLPANDESAIENGVIALYSYRSPLLIDPYGVAKDWLIKHLSPQKLVVSSASKKATNTAVWREIESSIKGEATLILTDVCKERIEGLRSFIRAKRRALFDAVNHGVSGITRSSGGYRCWCHPPDDINSSSDLDIPSLNPKAALTVLKQPIFEFGSDACKVYFIYTDANDLPEWLSEYLSQLAVIRFELTAPCVEAQALQKLLEAQGRLRELTEIRTLQNDMLICDEQIFGLEEELLAFFSTENAEQVYSENSKALRIVANRSSVHTLESTKAVASAKVHKHWTSLSSYVAVAKRCLDGLWAWRDFNSVAQNNDKFAETSTLSWFWRLLVRAGETSSKTDNNLELMACFTSYLEQYVVMNLRDDNRLLFRFLLAFRIWHRQVEEEEKSSGVELLGRLLILMSKTDRSGDDKCKPRLKTLLALRPTGMKSVTWSAISYLAEASEELRQFISKLESLENGQITWKALLEIGTLSSGDCDEPAPLDAFTQMCVVAAIHPYRFLCEIERFTTRALQRMHNLPASLPQSNLDTSTPALSTVVAAAAHTAMAQAPDKYSDLFYMWRSFSSSTSPLVVFCPLSIDFVDAVTNAARCAGATIDITDTIQLQLADEDTFKTLLLLAMEKGQWVVLPNLQTCPERLAQLSGIYESLSDGRIHLDFRLWISITTQSSGVKQIDFDAMRISRIATHREWDSGFLSLKRSLYHTFTVIKHELESIAYDAPGDSDVLNECVEQ